MVSFPCLLLLLGSPDFRILAVGDRTPVLFLTAVPHETGFYIFQRGKCNRSQLPVRA